MAEFRKPLFSDSELAPASSPRTNKRESFGEYLVSRRGSLSDLVFSNQQRKTSREPPLVPGNVRPTRHGSLTRVTPDRGERSTSLTSITNSQQRFERRSNSIVSIQERRFTKTKSLNSINCASIDEARRSVKGQWTNKRKRWLRRIQSIHAFDSVLRARQNRQKYHPLVRFRRAAKTIQLLLRAIAGSRQGHQHDHATWSQLVDEQSNARRTYDLFGISFDPTVFQAKREKKLGNEARFILTEPPADRSEEQIRLVLLALNQTVEAFGEFPIKLQKSLASVGWYEHFEAQRVIIRQGHMADNFYFILSGTAIVSLLETNKETNEQVVRTVAFLRKGNSFGELALMHGQRRSATVTCKSSVELLAVSREDFIDIFMHIEKDREPEHIHFLRTVDILRGWPVHKLPSDNPRVCLFTYFRRGVLLCKDSNTTEWIYVIKKGSCRVLKDLLETRPNIPGLETIPYCPNQVYVKLPPIPHVKQPTSPRTPVVRPPPELGLNGQRAFYRQLPAIHCRSTEERQGWLTDSDNNMYRMHFYEGYQLPNDIYYYYALGKVTGGIADENEVLTSTLDHQKTIEEIFEKRHKVSPATQRDRHSHASSSQENKHDSRKDPKVFVQIQTVGPREVFGLEHTVFGMMGKTTGCSLVSDGAECILINKKFFMQHLPDDIGKRIRKTIQPIPTEESLQQKLQDKANWDAYKSMTVTDFIVFRRQLHEHMADYPGQIF